MFLLISSIMSGTAGCNHIICFRFHCHFEQNMMMMMMRTLFILRLADRVPYFRRLYDSLLSVYDKLTIEFD